MDVQVCECLRAAQNHLDADVLLMAANAWGKGWLAWRDKLMDIDFEKI